MAQMAQDLISRLFSVILPKAGQGPTRLVFALPLLVVAGLLIGLATGGETAARSERAIETTYGAAHAPAPAPAKDEAKHATAGKVDAKSAGEKATAAPIQLAAAEKSAGNGAFDDKQRAEIGRIVRAYLLANPKILEEVSIELTKIREREKEQQREQVLVDEKQSIFRSPLDFVLGNPEGDITVVEYFDYNCGWCKRALKEVSTLTKVDQNVRVVMKEFPIFGEGSEFAARAAMASKVQGKYWEFHTALMQAKRVTKENTLEIASQVGIDVAALQEEMKKPKYQQAIADNGRIAQALGMQGTPGFIIDNRVNYGYLPADGLKQIVAEVREKGCKVC